MLQEKRLNTQYETQATSYNELAAALGESNPAYEARTAPPYKYLLPRAANAILMLVPPPTSEVDEASWGAFLNGEEGGN